MVLELSDFFELLFCVKSLESLKKSFFAVSRLIFFVLGMHIKIESIVSHFSFYIFVHYAIHFNFTIISLIVLTSWFDKEDSWELLIQLTGNHHINSYPGLLPTDLKLFVACIEQPTCIQKD